MEATTVTYSRDGLEIAHVGAFAAWPPESMRTRLNLNLDFACVDGMFEFVVIAFSLVGIGDGEAGDCFVKDVAFSQIPCDHRWIAGARMSAGQRPAAYSRVIHHGARVKEFNQYLDFHVAQLANVKMPSRLAGGPAEKDIACRLHEPLPVYHPLAVIGILALAGITFKH